MQLDERTRRARVVATEYSIEKSQPGLWIVMHHSEPDRCYLVTLTNSGAECTCPDFQCTTKALGMKCKHILALEILHPGEQWTRRLLANNAPEIEKHAPKIVVIEPTDARLYRKMTEEEIRAYELEADAMFE